MELNKGIRRDGAEGLDYCVNLLPEGDGLRLLPEMEAVDVPIEEGDVLLCVHHVGDTQAEKRYVVRNGCRLLALGGGVRQLVATLEEPVEKVVAIGNMLMAATSNGLYYVRWNVGVYQLLGDRLPKVDLQFQLRQTYVQTFVKGTDTGVVLERPSNVHGMDFSTTVAPTPLTVSFMGDHELRIEVALDASTTYRLELRRTGGKAKLGGRLWVVYDDATERLADYDFGKSITFTFATDGEAHAVGLRCALYGNADYSYRFSAVLLKGTVVDADLVFGGTEENFTALMGVANRFVNRYGREVNHFVYPFFVRYALKLYDGSMVCPSAPCLMVPNQGVAPHVWTFGVTAGQACDLYVSANIGELQFRLLASEGLSAWKDLVQSVVVAVSSPVYSFNEGAEWKSDKTLVEVERMDGSIPEDVMSWGYGQFDEGSGACSSDYQFRHNNSLEGQHLYHLRLPSFDASEIQKKVTETGVFHVVKEIPMAQLPAGGGWVTMEMDDETLVGLEARPVLDDDVMSLSLRTGKVMTAYNARLVIGDVTEHRFGGYMPSLLNGYAGDYVDGEAQGVRTTMMKALVKNVVDGRSYCLCAADDLFANNAPLFWYFFPDASAQSAVVWRRLSDGGYQRAELPLRKHPLLNGAYWFDGFREPVWSESVVYADLSEDQRSEVDHTTGSVVVSRPDLLQQSEVDNPFRFVASLTNRVGHTYITGLATTTHTLSEGQFGDFPLYVFTGDGIWAMGIADDGRLVARQPVSRDVCEGSSSLVMTDRAVVYVSRQGLKLLSGSSVPHLSGPLEGAVADMELLRGVDAAYDGLVAQLNPDFLADLKGATLAYDHPNACLHVFVRGVALHYVMDLGTGEFTLSDEVGYPLSVVNDYPDTLVQTSTGVWRFSNVRTNGCRKAMAVTQPIALGDGVEVGRLRDLRCLWNRKCDGSSVRLAVFASNDGYRWWRMRSLDGHSYRWVRIAIFANINDHERIKVLLFKN